MTPKAEFAMLRPVDPDRDAHWVLFDVVNRGRKTVLSFSSAQRSPAPLASLESGNGFLMRHGYTVVWCGWHVRLPPAPDLMGLMAPSST